MSNIVVAVSPHYQGRGWTDQATQVSFEPQAMGLKAQSIKVTEETDLSGIKNSVRLNHLLLLEGEFPKGTPNEPSQINPEELTVEELNELLSGNTGSGTGDKKLKDEIGRLKKENDSLKKELEKYNQEEVKENMELETEEDTEKEFNRNKDGTVSKAYLNNNYTLDKLKELADKEGIEYKKSANKSELVDLLSKEL